MIDRAGRQQHRPGRGDLAPSAIQGVGADTQAIGPGIAMVPPWLINVPLLIASEEALLARVPSVSSSVPATDSDVAPVSNCWMVPARLLSCWTSSERGPLKVN